VQGKKVKEKKGKTMFHAGSANQNLDNIEYAFKIRTSGIVIGTGYGELRKEQGTRHKEKESHRK
jgi:hypothetical protein